jgi:hypothetical protein
MGRGFSKRTIKKEELRRGIDKKVEGRITQGRRQKGRIKEK